jgi:hypothetical protein
MNNPTEIQSFTARKHFADAGSEFHYAVVTREIDGDRFQIEVSDFGSRNEAMSAACDIAKLDDLDFLQRCSSI